MHKLCLKVLLIRCFLKMLMQLFEDGWPDGVKRQVNNFQD